MHLNALVSKIDPRQSVRQGKGQPYAVALQEKVLGERCFDHPLSKHTRLSYPYFDASQLKFATLK
jgi:hypothetical protein